MNDHPLSATVTVFHGDNRLEIRERVDAAHSVIDPTGLSTSVFENASASVGDVAAAVGSPGFFGADRLVICHNLVTAVPTSRRKKSKTPDEGSNPLSILGSVAPGVWVLVIEDSLKSADEKRLRTFATDISIERLSVPRGRQLLDWTTTRARRYSSTIDGATATRLVEALFPGTWREVARRDDVPPDLYRLDSELAKLATAVGPDGEITPDMVSELVPNADALDIWGLSNAIADRDQSRAIKQLELALDSGQPAEMILGQLGAQFETLAVVNAARGRPNEIVAKRTGLTEGRLRQAARSARNFSRMDLSKALTAIRDVDYGIKQGLHEPEDALVSLVASLSRRTATR
jgi:DNA polymerase III subunit delta